MCDYCFAQCETGECPELKRDGDEPPYMDGLCENCVKEDVCMYRPLVEAALDRIEEETAIGVLDIEVGCVLFVPKVDYFS